eukprot:m.51348 g.51348  ORF g.51348 m.51348 type:complete len:365 (-) comp10936_c0_seq2:177-1271(-)
MSSDHHEDAIFVNPLKDDDPLRCTICCNVLKDAVQCPNQHCFCAGCLKKSLERKNECPICKVRISEGVPSINMRSLVNRLEVYCPRRDEGCRITSQLDRIASHDKSCEYASVECKFSGCGRRILRKELQQHALQCSRAATNCAICGKAVKNSEVVKHACLSTIMDQIKALEGTVIDLKKKLESETKARIALEKRVNSGTITTNSSSKPQPVPTRQLGVLNTHQRPQVGSVVALSGSEAKGCLLRNSVGWIAKDEHDHQPFHVHTSKRKSYWYRESEIKLVAQPNDVIAERVALVGLPCIRGPDWEWGNQDGQTYGFITEVHGGGYCSVKWANNRTGKYRCGAQNSYDLLVADMTKHKYPTPSNM